MKVSLEQAELLDRGGFIAYRYGTEGASFTALAVESLDGHPKTRILTGTRLYFVSSGGGTFSIDDVAHAANKGDLFVIEAGQEYEYAGSMELFECNVPASTTAERVATES